LTNKIKKDNSTSFVNNMSLPMHRWYRYSAGFHAEWVEQLIKEKTKDINEKFRIYDPFTGSGTVLLTSDKLGFESYGVDPHPFISRVVEAKLLWDTDFDLFVDYAGKVLNESKKKKGFTENYPELIKKCYPEDILYMLDALKSVLEEKKDDSNEHKLTWLAFVSILRTCSTAGTAQWQYILPNKTKKLKNHPFETFEKKINIMYEDMKFMQSCSSKSKAKFFRQDCREQNSVPDKSIDLVITSPPYANNYDYADATRLELTFLGEIEKWGDLQDYVRKYLMRSCTQHVSKLRKETFEIIKDDKLKCIYDEIFEVCKKLEGEREYRSGKKNYHTMIATYFLDIAKVWIDLRRVCKENSEVCFVIGDSAPYGVYVPVDEWMGKLALAAGFKEYKFDKTRDRNVKWDNRTHKKPLKEGRLWVKG
jgi:DNA modification methylase